MTFIRRWVFVLGMMALTGCGVGAVAPVPTELDLGAAGAGSPATWGFKGLVLPPFNQWGAGNGDAVIWREGINGSPNRYATFRWRDTPATLVRERLVERLSLHGPVLLESISVDLPQLQVTLMQFEQVFAADGSTNDARVTLQALLLRNGDVLDQFLVTVSEPGQANDAPAGAVALRVATDRVIARLLQWLEQPLSVAR